MADPLEILRQDVLQKRIHGGVAGGLKVSWSARDIAHIHDHVMAMKSARDLSEASRKPVDVAAIKTEVREAGPDDLHFLFVVSSEAVDLAGDVVTASGIDTRNFDKNPAVLDSHDSTKLPVASSSAPAVAGKSLTAVAHFPSAGVNRNSDRVAAAVRAKLVRGASIGFMPLRWSFSKDPSRPTMGVDFHEIMLLEWSVCAVPANPSCLLLGAFATGKSAGDAVERIRTAERLREARLLAAEVKITSSENGAPTRAQRIAEAQELRRAVFIR